MRDGAAGPVDASLPARTGVAARYGFSASDCRSSNRPRRSLPTRCSTEPREALDRCRDELEPAYRLYDGKLNVAFGLLVLLRLSAAPGQSKSNTGVFDTVFVRANAVGDEQQDVEQADRAARRRHQHSDRDRNRIFAGDHESDR